MLFSALIWISFDSEPSALRKSNFLHCLPMNYRREQEWYIDRGLTCSPSRLEPDSACSRRKSLPVRNKRTTEPWLVLDRQWIMCRTVSTTIKKNIIFQQTLRLRAFFYRFFFYLLHGTVQRFWPNSMTGDLVLFLTYLDDEVRASSVQHGAACRCCISDLVLLGDWSVYVVAGKCKEEWDNLTFFCNSWWIWGKACFLNVVIAKKISVNESFVIEWSWTEYWSVLEIPIAVFGDKWNLKFQSF